MWDVKMRLAHVPGSERASGDRNCQDVKNSAESV